MATVLAAGSELAAAPDTVRVGHPALREARLRPGTEVVDAWRIEGGTRTPTSTTVREVSFREGASGGVWTLVTLHGVPGGDTSRTVVEVRAADLSLARYKVKATRDSAAVTVADRHLTGWVVLPGQPVRLLDQALERPVFAVEGQIPWMLPLLPLREGYRAADSHYSQWEGREVWSTLEVVGAERVTLDGVTFDCWKVDTGPLGPPGYRMIRWVDHAARRVFQSVLRGGTGGPEYWSAMRR